MLGLAPATAMLAGVDPLATVLVAASVLLSRGLGSALAGSALNFALTERRAVSVGGGERALTVMTALVDAGVDIRVCGIFDDRDDSRSPPVVRGVPKLGTLVDLVAFVRAPEIDMLIVTLPLRADRRIREVLKAVEVLPVDVRLSGFSDDPAFRRRGASPARGGLIGVMSRPLRQRQRLVKRGLDLAGTAAAVLLLSPVLLQPPARRRSRANSIYAVRLPSRDDLGAAYFFSSQPYHPFSLGGFRFPSLPMQLIGEAIRKRGTDPMTTRVLLGLLVLPQAAWAQGGFQVHAAPFLSGLIHTILSPAHLLAMVAVGLLAAAAGGVARWACMASSLTAIAIGSAAGVMQPYPELIAAVPVLVLCLAVSALAARSPFVAVCSAIAALGAAHGYAHGLEMPEGGGLLFASGLMLATFLLHGTGLLFGFAVGRTQPAVTGAIAAVTCVLGLLVVVG